MSKFAVVKTGGKQYIVKEGDTLVVDRLSNELKSNVELETLAVFDDNGALELGKPVLSQKTAAVVEEQGKGEKVRISKFKAKVRYRRTTGFRPSLTKIKITKI